MASATTIQQQAFCLKRNNHLNDMVIDLEEMLKDENMVDVSLSCEEGIIKAHKIILSACSPYFRQIFSRVQLNNQYPIIIIKDMSYQDLKYIIDFIYRGEITVPQQHLNSVLKSAEALKIKGLPNVNSFHYKSTCSSSSSSVSSKNSDLNANPKRKKKRKKTIHMSSRQVEQELKKISHHSNSCEDDATDYSEEDETIHHHSQANTSLHHHQINSQPSTHHNILQNASTMTGSHHNSPALNENEIEPSRLLEQTMVTGDSQNLSNMSSIGQCNNQSKYPQYLLSNVKQMMYDDSSGLIENQHASNNQNTLTSNHNLSLTQFEESASMAGPSSISLSRQIGGLSDDNFDADHLLNTTSPIDPLNSAGTLSHLNNPLSHHNMAGGEELHHGESSNKQKRSYQCNFCLKKFDIRYSLQRHLKVIHDPQRHMFTCEVCSKKFAWKSAFLRHVNVTCNRQRRDN